MKPSSINITQNIVRVARMKHRVVILTEIIAPYRIPVFNALARHAELDLHVLFMAETDKRCGSGASMPMRYASRMKSYPPGDGAWEKAAYW